jgi:hypothetical protein
LTEDFINPRKAWWFMSNLTAGNEIITALAGSKIIEVVATKEVEIAKEKEAAVKSAEAAPAEATKEELTIISNADGEAVDTSADTAGDVTAADNTAASNEVTAGDTAAVTGAAETETAADPGTAESEAVAADTVSNEILAKEAAAGVNVDPGYTDGMNAGMNVDPGIPQAKDPLLSSWPFVIGISSAVLFVSVVLGVLLAKRKIKKGIDLYED